MTHPADPEHRRDEAEPSSANPEPPPRDDPKPPSANPGIGATAVLPPKADGAPRWKGPALVAAAILAIFLVLLLLF